LEESEEEQKRMRKWGITCALLGILLTSRGEFGYGNTRENPWKPFHEDFAFGEDSFVLHASPETLEDGGDVVISWHTFASQHENDFLSISCGPTIDAGDYLDRVNATFGERNDGIGGTEDVKSIRFEDLHMLRCEYKILYQNYVESAHTFRTLGEITVPMKESINTPKHGHLSFSSNEREMVLMFNSASNKFTPTVKYGTSSISLTELRHGTSTTYKASDMYVV